MSRESSNYPVLHFTKVPHHLLPTSFRHIYKKFSHLEDLRTKKGFSKSLNAFFVISDIMTKEKSKKEESASGGGNPGPVGLNF